MVKYWLFLCTSSAFLMLLYDSSCCFFSVSRHGCCGKMSFTKPAFCIPLKKNKSTQIHLAYSNSHKPLERPDLRPEYHGDLRVDSFHSGLQCWGKLLLKVIHSNDALLPKNNLLHSLLLSEVVCAVTLYIYSIYNSHSNKPFCCDATLDT